MLLTQFEGFTSLDVEVSDYTDYRSFELGTLYEFEGQSSIDPDVLNMQLVFLLKTEERQNTICHLRLKNFPGSRGVVIIYNLNYGIVSNEGWAAIWEILDGFLKSLGATHVQLLLGIKGTPTNKQFKKVDQYSSHTLYSKPL